MPPENSAAIEAVGTTAGLYVARWMEPRLKVGLTEALEGLKVVNPTAHRVLLHGWKVDPSYRSTIDRTTILGITAINAVSSKITPYLGPFAEVADEIMERVITAVPDILPEVLTPLAERFVPEPGTPPPDRTAISRAMGEYLKIFGEKLPRSIVGQVDVFNPSRWFVKMGEQMQQAIDACGPLAELQMAIFWIDQLNNDERDKYSTVYFAFNSPGEVMNFIGLPNDEARKKWLEMLFELHKMRLPLSLHEQRELFERLKGLHREQVAPFLNGITAAIRRKREEWRRDHPDLLPDPIHRTPVLRTAPAPRRGLGRVPVMVWVLLGILLLAVASNLLYHN